MIRPRQFVIACILMMAVGSADAQSRVQQMDRGVVTVGDGPGAVIQRAGRQPDRIVTLQNHRGAAVGERWEYYLRGKQVNLTFRGGRVVGIEEIR